MRVLIVARCKEGRYAPFITEQVDALRDMGVDCDYFSIDGKGLIGYIKHLPKLKKAIRIEHPDIIHAHYGLCGLLANLQRRVPVVTTYHGSDINNPKVFKLSEWSIRLSAHNVFVSKKNIEIARPKRSNHSLIPCGINPEDYPIIDKQKARKLMGLTPQGKYVLFSGAFDNRVKNAPLANAAISQLERVELIELKGYSRSQVAVLMQAVDTILMTSFTEGSPQVIKEAMVCGCPIVSVDVGDVREMTEGLAGCYISDREPDSIAKCILKSIDFGRRTEGRAIILKKGLSNDIIASKLFDIYNSLVSK